MQESDRRDFPPGRNLDDLEDMTNALVLEVRPSV